MNRIIECDVSDFKIYFDTTFLNFFVDQNMSSCVLHVKTAVSIKSSYGSIIIRTAINLRQIQMHSMDVVLTDLKHTAMYRLSIKSGHRGKK